MSIEVEVIELKDFGPRTRFDAAYAIDDDGYIVCIVSEPEARNNDNFPENVFREKVRETLSEIIEPPYTIQWDPGRDNVEEERIG